PLSAFTLRPPQGGVRTHRTRHPALRRLSDPPVLVASQTPPRCARQLGIEEPETAAALGHQARRVARERADPRLPGRAVGAELDRHGALVGLSGVLAGPMDDGVAGAQSTPGGRRTRRDGGVTGPPP